MIDRDLLLSPERVQQAVLAALVEDLECQRTPAGIQIDTPFILQDGRLFRALIRPTGENGTVVTSDGGFAVEQFEIRFSSVQARRERVEQLKRIAVELHLDPLDTNDGSLTFRSESLEEAARRLPILAQAADRALSLLQSRIRGKERPLRSRLADDFQDNGFDVGRGRKIEIGHDTYVKVDLELGRQDRPVAAVQVLSAVTQSGAVIAADRAVVNLTRLSRASYDGKLFAVFNTHSPSGVEQVLNRFAAAKPEQAVLVPSDDAVEIITNALVA